MRLSIPIHLLSFVVVISTAGSLELGAQGLFEKVFPASTFSIEPSIRSSQMAQGDGASWVMANANIGTLGDADMLLLKLNEAGDIMHSLKIGDIGGQGYHDVGMEAVQLGSDIFLCGYTRAIDTAATPTFTSFLIKLDTALNLLWQQNYILPGPLELYANAMTATDNGQLLIAGQIFDGSDFHTMLMKVAADGSLIWMKQYDIPFGERVHCVRELVSQEILLSGNVIFDFELVLPFAFKVEADGDLVWGKYYNYPPMSIVEHSNFLFSHALNVADIVLCGHTDVLGVGGQDFFVVGIDSSGTVNWARTYGAPQGEFPSAATYDAAADELVMLGNSSSWSFSFTPAPVVMRIATGGLLIDAKLVGDTATTQLGTLTATHRVNANSRTLTGWRGFSSDDLYVTGMDNDLDNVCHVYPITPATPAQVTTTGPFVANVTSPVPVMNDLEFATATFSGGTLLCTGTTDMPEHSGSSGQSIEVFPNPASSDFLLVSDQLLDAGCTIELLDVHGQAVRLLRGSGDHQMHIERGALGPGMYMVQAKREGRVLGAVRIILE